MREGNNTTRKIDASTTGYSTDIGRRNTTKGQRAVCLFTCLFDGVYLGCLETRQKNAGTKAGEERTRKHVVLFSSTSTPVLPAPTLSGQMPTNLEL